MDQKGSSDPKDTRRTKTFAYWLIIALSVIAAGILLFLGRESSVRTILSAAGASLLGATFFSALLPLFNRESDRHLEALLRSIFREYLLDMVRSVSRLHVPSAEYPPTDSFDPAFMLDLMADLSRSSKFWYRGTSGKWVAPYINYCRKPIMEIKAIILDPTKQSAISQRAADRKQTEKNANRTINELAEEIKHEISMAVVSLYDARHKSRIEIFLSESTASTVSGIDLTDEAVYVGLHLTGRAAKNPTSYRYEKDSLAYQNYSIELGRQSDIARITITFDHNSKIHDLMKAFKTLGMDDIKTDQQIKDLRNEAKELQKNFFTNMEAASANPPR